TFRCRGRHPPRGHLLSDHARRDAGLQRIARAARRTEARMRAAGALDTMVSTLAVALVVVALALTLAKVWPGFPREGVRDAVAGAVVAILGRTMGRSLRRLPKFAGA